MAEEEVVILEESDETPESGSAPKPPDKKRKRMVWLLVATGGVFVLILVILLIVLASKKSSETQSTNTEKLIEKIKSSEKIKPLAAQSQLEQMIKKANILYARGNKKEALNLFEQIATFSASISSYNLGVAQMRQGKYEEAIKSFKKAIINGENRCISAVNAAASALHLHDKKRFEYYLQLAQAYLPDSYNSPLYSYLYAVINYYRGNYFEILSAVAHPASNAYNKNLSRLGSIGYTVFERPLKAIDLMEIEPAANEFLLLGQMYARIGDYTVATQYLKRAAEKSEKSVKSLKALALVELKNQMPAHAAKLLKRLKTDFKGKGLELYPVKTELSAAVYDIDAAQRRFSAESILMPPQAYKLFFEFAPFKVFDATQTINFIKKGNAAIYVEEDKEAARILSRSSSLSHANLQISKAIKAAIDHHIRIANAILRKALERYPNHSILHYNLGLTYAQIGNYSKAHEHFLRSYHLDSANYLSAIFALMCEQLIGKPIPQVEQFVSDDLTQMLKPTTLQSFYKTLFFIYKGNIAAASKWLSTPHGNRPIYLLTDILVAANEGAWERAKKSAEKLRNYMGDEVLPHMLYLQIAYRHLKIKRFSIQAQKYLKEHPLNLDAVYYGSAFTRENYITLRFVTGTLYTFKTRLEEKLLGEMEDPAGIIEALGLTDIYLQAYEEAYQLFNQLVDKYGHDDSRTLFLSAVAAVGAKHPANASALLELAKLTDPNNLESRYALGLLYMQQKNYDAAIIQFEKIPNGAFRSDYFDFDIASSQPSG
ncbi:tetratricopeptide repeat protein [Hydrogenimonas sp.]